MRVGNFSVLIPEGSERDSGYVGLEHGNNFVIRLMNHTHQQCDAEVTVDGKDVGCFRIDAHGSCTLERSPDDNGRFTFFSAGTDDANKAGEFGIAAADKGLIQVKFVPERQREYRPSVVRGMGGVFGMWEGGPSMGGWSRDRGTTECDAGNEKTVGGITGLSGHSDQQFRTVGSIDRDESQAVTISLRLITANFGPRPLKAANRGNPVPEPV